MIIKPGYAGIVIELPEDAIIADIGFGHDPVRGATYYIDKDLDVSADRGGRKAALVPMDKFIQADISTGIPLPDRSCDFVVAAHIAEHLDDPEAFCKELMRIGNAGYIETPGTVQELIDNQPIHKWFVTKLGDKIVFVRKRWIFARAWKVPSSFITRIILYLFRQTCYHWTGKINIVVI